MSSNRSLRIGTLSAALLAVFHFAGFAGAASPAPLQTYQSPDGQTYYAMSLAPEVGTAAPAAPRDVVLLFDTSASQAGIYRETAFAALETCLSKLRADDRVQIIAVDLDARGVTSQFISPSGAEADAAVAALHNELPLGSTDMEQALSAAQARFDSASSRARAILYIGDGMSLANLMGTETFRSMIDGLAEARISVSSYAIGPQRDAQLLAALANQTGGNLYVDEPMERANEAEGVTAERAEQENLRRGSVVGATLADWVRVDVLWPGETRWPDALGEVYPSRMPPLRSDRDSIVVGVASRPLSTPVGLRVQAVGEAGVRDLVWTTQPSEPHDDNAFLTQIVETAQRDGGLSLTTLGSRGLAETGRAIQASWTGMTNLAEQAVATGDAAGAQVLTQAVLSRDPGHRRARAAQTAAANMQVAGQADNTPTAQASVGGAAARPAGPATGPAAGEADLSLIRVAQAEPIPQPGVPPAAPPAEGSLIDRFASEGTFLDEVERRRRVYREALRREVDNTIAEARTRMASDPESASQLLKLALQSVEQATELDAGPRALMVDRIQTALREVQRQAVIQDENERARQQALAAAEEIRMLNEQLLRRIEREKQLMQRFGALLDERRYGEAQQVAAIVEEIDPNGVMPRVAMVSSRIMEQEYLQQVNRAARHQGFLAALYQVEIALVPMSDEPPIVYPDAEWWEAMSIRREPYQSVDLSALSASEQRISEALGGPLVRGLDFFETPLSEVVSTLSNDYEIPIYIKEQALDDVGLSRDDPITADLNNISLRSALSLILDQLDLTYVIQNEVLNITTVEDAETNPPPPKVYPVADLVIPIQSGGGGGFGGGIGGLGGGGLGGGGFGGGGLGGGGLGGGGFGGGGLGGFGGGFGAFSVPEKDDADGESPSAPQAADSSPVLPGGRADSQVSSTDAGSSASVEPASQDRPRPLPHMGIEVDQSVSPDLFWNRYFSAERREPDTVRKAAHTLIQASRFEHVIALIQAALRHGQPQPWMYESLGIALELEGRPRPEIERAIMSAVDFATHPDQLMLIARYLERSGSDGRALQLYRQVVKVDPLLLEAYALGLRAAQRLQDMDGIQWATVGILSNAWPEEQSAIQVTAMGAAQAAIEELARQGRQEERDRFARQLQAASVRDCVVRVSWTGQADVDLAVEEPSGSVCSPNNPRTIGGGVSMGDQYADTQSPSGSGYQETYICPQGFAGTYRARIRRVMGEVTAGKVTVDVILHYRDGRQKHERQQLAVGDEDVIVQFTLDEGRRSEPLDAVQLASAVERQQEVGRAVLAQQLEEAYDPGITPDRSDLAAAQLARQRQRIAAVTRGGSAVGFQPVITTLPEGTNLSASAVISADRRYVRINATPSFNSVGDVTTFTFAGTGDTGEMGGQDQGQGQGQATNININIPAGQAAANAADDGDGG